MTGLSAPILTKALATVRTVSLSLAAIVVLILCLGMDIGKNKALCGGQPYARTSISGGSSPYVELTADGIKGPFLLDYGATRSSLSAAAFPGSDGSIRHAAISLPDIKSADFHLARYDLLFQPEKGQLGVIGDDLLSRFTVQLTPNTAYLGAEPCSPEALLAAGLTPIAQNGFFSSDPKKISAGLPNVPVAFLRLGEIRVWAQIDTGYEDFLRGHSIDINQALFDRLLTSRVKLERLHDVDVWTCDGRERRAVYRVENAPLVIEDGQAKPIVTTQDFHLIVKPADACGGIADFSEPAAQLGASFLRLFSAVIFDPNAETVWLGRSGNP